MRAGKGNAYARLSRLLILFVIYMLTCYLRCYAYVSVAVDLYLGKCYIVLSDEVERQLRFAAVKRLGGKKGDLSNAIELAVVDWLKKDWKP
ncbi:MAG: hypothetical protein ABSA92_05505 [Candidatus Bathyarchaeia archaeon]